MKKIHIVIALLSLVFSGNAQDRFIIQNVKVFDGEKIINSTSIKVENGIISKISKSIKPEEDFNIINGEGKSLMPALSNAHVHAWSPQSLKEAAKAGVLNVMDMHGVESFQKGMRTYKDSTDYANYYIAGYAATAPGGHGTQFGFPVPTLEKPEEAEKFISDRVEAGVDYIKIILEPWKTTLNSETVSKLINEAHKMNKKAVVHISRLDDALDVISNNTDGLVHIWWDKEIDNTKLRELADSKSFFVIPTLLTTIKVFESMGEQSKNLLSKEQLLMEVKKMYEAGVPILAGTDPPNVGINYGTDLYKELELIAEAGLPIVEVLKAGTSHIAKSFDLIETGFIKEGFSADFILIDGDVTEDISVLNNPKQVYKKGKEVK